MGIIARARRAAPWISSVWLAVGHAGRCVVAAAGLCLVALVMLVCVLALCAAFASAPARRRACMAALETVLAVVPWRPRA